jgi:hypothetical protein
MLDKTKEYIICAANWYKDLPLVNDDLDGFNRPLNCDRGIVFCGHRHHNCMYLMIAITGLYQHLAGEEIQGFLTSQNRFVNREDGAKIALKSGQIDKLNYSTKDLYSEDLY